MEKRRWAILISAAISATGAAKADSPREADSPVRGLASLPAGDAFGAFRLGVTPGRPYGNAEGLRLGGASFRLGDPNEPSAEWFREMYKDNPLFLKQIGLEPGKLHKFIEIKVGRGK